MFLSLSEAQIDVCVCSFNRILVLLLFISSVMMWAWCDPLKSASEWTWCDLYVVVFFKKAHFCVDMCSFYKCLPMYSFFLSFFSPCIICVTSQGTCTEGLLWKENYIFFFQINRLTEWCVLWFGFYWCTKRKQLTWNTITTQKCK